MNGPGGYYGWNLDAVVDCLRGGWGARPPFTLWWQDSEVAQQEFETGLTILRDEGMEVRLL